MRIALTGTPGVGKTSSSNLVRSLRVMHLSDVIEGSDAVTGVDEKRDTKEVDLDKLRAATAGMDRDVLVEGHLSHLIDVDVAVVLRCSPTVLRERLLSKGWPEEKIRENMEAEAVDVILIEAIEEVKTVCEIDSTFRTPEEVARAIDEIAAGETQKYPVGNVDWSQEVLSWF